MNNVLADVMLGPADGDFASRCSGWNTRIVHRPDYIVVAQTPGHVQEAVRFAAGRGMPIYVQSTGHGALAPCDGGVLIDTSGIGGVEIDVSQRLATVAQEYGGKSYSMPAQIHGLAGLSGSGSSVGVVGYAVGGGSGWLFRRYGLCSDTIEAAEITTADGVQRWVNPETEPDLLWALRGGGGNFGVVTTLQLRLVPAPTVYAGAIYWPMARAKEVLEAYARMVRDSSPRRGIGDRIFAVPIPCSSA